MTLAPNAEPLAVDLSLPVFMTQVSVTDGFKHPTFPSDCACNLEFGLIIKIRLILKVGI